MKAVIVYNSRSGFSKKYANWLSYQTEIEAFDFKDKPDVSKYDTVIFASWVKNGRLKKFSYLIDNQLKDKTKIILAVGIINNKNVIKRFVRDHQAYVDEIFYVPGGLDYSKLNFFDKKILKTVAGSMIKADKDADYARLLYKSFD